MAWWTMQVADLLALESAGALAAVDVEGTLGVVLDPLDRAVAVAHPVAGSGRDWRVLVWLTGPVDACSAWLTAEVALAGGVPAHAEVVVDSPASDRPAARRVFEVVEALSAAQMTLFALDTAAERAVLALRTAGLCVRVPGLVVSHAGGAAPFQARGRWCGLGWHLRVRRGVVSLGVGGDDPVGAPLWSGQMVFGDDFDGHVTLEEFADLFVAVAARLGRAPFRYTFATVVDPLEPLARATPSSVAGYGLSVAEGYAAAVRAADAFDWPVTLEAEPLAGDPRVYPVSPPDLSVDGTSLAPILAVK